MSCPQCAEPVGASDAFCESCGATLSPAAPEPVAAPAQADPPATRKCAACGGEVGEDGWCTVCGIRASNGREHVVEQPSPTVVGVSDKGLVHARNEDACALATDGSFTVLVVCDGVTTATDSDTAALAAANAARDMLAAAPRPGGPAAGTSSGTSTGTSTGTSGGGSRGTAAQRQAHWAKQLKAAAQAADVAAEATASPGDDNPPSCTFVAAIADGTAIVAGWVGDSRAYWLPDEGPAEQLSVDDSWATEQVAGGVAREIAEADSRAHAITKWLGADSPDVNASTAATTATTAGWLLVCSDGLWNYCSTADDLHKLVAAQPSEPLARAEALVQWANEQGGHDNITVTLARIAPEE